MTDWIGGLYAADPGWSHLETLVDIGDRMAGSDGERRGAEATRDALAAHARDARLDAFDVQGWERGASAVDAGDERFERTHECIALPRSPPGEATGRLVDVGHGLPGDFEADLEGAVVLARSDVPDDYDRYIHRREKYYRAVEGGAAAFCYANHVEGCLPPTGSVGSDGDPIGAVPAVGVSAEVGARLARRHEGAELSVDVETDVGPAESRNVHAELGPDTGEELLVTSHVDAHDIAEGAADNGAGTAVLVAVARSLAAREADLDRRVRFVAFGAEEVGLVGSGYEAGRADTEAIRAVVNLDGVVRGRTLSVSTHGSDALGAAARRAGDRLGHPVEVSPEQSPHSDHWPFVVEGVPGCHVSSDTGPGRGWGHTAADTLDKLDRRDLREHAIVVTELVADLAAADRAVERVDPDDVAAACEAEDLAEGMRLTGDWPF